MSAPAMAEFIGKIASRPVMVRSPDGQRWAGCALRVWDPQRGRAQFGVLIAPEARSKQLLKRSRNDLVEIRAHRHIDRWQSADGHEREGWLLLAESVRTARVRP
jgi:hypothetical protein